MRAVLAGVIVALGLAAAAARHPRPAAAPPPPAAPAAGLAPLPERPLDAIEAERRTTLSEAQDLERRLRTLRDTQEQRRARARLRLRALYKLSQGGFGRLLLGSETPNAMYVRRNGARLVIGRDLEELGALRDEVTEIGKEQAELSDRTGRLAQLEAAATAARAELAGGDRRLAGLGRLRGLLPRPVSPGAIVVPFGREIIDRGLESFRHGAELSAEPGNQIRAVAPGQVRYAGEVAGLGRGVILEHEGGYLTLYARLDRALVTLGESVAQGAPLGRALYPKVFFQLALGDLPLDPEPWLQERGARGLRDP